ERFIERYGAGSTSSCSSSQPMTQMDALRTLLDNFDLADTAAGIGSRDGVIGRADLQALIDAPGTTPKLKAAARYGLDHFSRFDEAAGLWGKEDGLIGRIDLQVGMEGASMNRSRAIDVFRANFAQLDTAGHGGCPDGLVSRDDVQAALKDPNSSPE